MARRAQSLGALQRPRACRTPRAEPAAGESAEEKVVSAYPQKSLGREKAIALAKTEWWIGRTAREIVQVQLFTQELVVPIAILMPAMNEAFGRPVYTHELGLNYDGLVQEFLGERDAPTFDEILA